MHKEPWLAAILGLYVTLAFVYSWLIPPWEGPDEPAHYILAVNLARVGIFSSTERNYEAGQPQTYYRLMSVPLKALYTINPDWVAVIQPERNYGNVRKPAPIFFWSDENYRFLPGLYLLRWLNILVGAGALGINYTAIRKFVVKIPGFSRTEKETGLPDGLPLSASALPEKKNGFSAVALSGLALAALTPQFLHTTSSVSNDTLGILAGAILFWLAAKIMPEEIQPAWLGLAIICGILLPYITKLTVLPVGLALIGGVVVKARERWPRGWKWLAGGGSIAGAGLVLLLIFLVPEMGALFWRQIQLRLFSIHSDASSPEYIGKMVTQVLWSYWGLLGWLQVGLPAWVVILLSVLGVVGVGATGIRRKGDAVAQQPSEIRGKWEKESRSGVLRTWGPGEKRVVWLIAGLAVLAVLRNGLSTINSQGRFLFPAIGALSLLMINGWEILLPVRFRRCLLPGVISLMIAANLILWIWGLIPVYFQPFLD